MALQPQSVPQDAEPGADSAGGAPNEIQTWPLSLLLSTRAVSRVVDRILLVIGYICGIELLLLGLFITYQVIIRALSRNFPGIIAIQAPGTDVMSGYTLAMAATWAIAYALRTGSHVRIDVLLPMMPRKVRWVADQAALLSVLFFGGVTAWKMWDQVLLDYQWGAVTTDYPLTPLWIPKTVIAIGFSLVSMVAIFMFLRMIAEAVLPRLHQAMGGQAVESEDVLTSAQSGIS